MPGRDFHFPSGGKYTAETAFWEASHFFSRDFLLWVWLGRGLRLPPELLCVGALVCALLTALAIVQGHWWLALLVMHINTALDCADGTLARYTGQASRFGRFLDTSCDGIGITVIVIALTYQLTLTHHWALSLLAGVVLWLSIFLQCSLANYANLRYAAHVGNTAINSRIDERFTSTREHITGAQRIVQWIYSVIFGWQDRWCVRVYRRMERAVSADQQKIFYGTKLFLSLHSFFFFGIAVQAILIASALASVESAVVGYLAISLSAHGLLLYAKVAFAKRPITHPLDEKKTPLS